MARQREAHESTRLADSAAQRAYLLEVAGLRHNEVAAETELARCGSKYYSLGPLCAACLGLILLREKCNDQVTEVSDCET